MNGDLAASSVPRHICGVVEVEGILGLVLSFFVVSGGWHDRFVDLGLGVLVVVTEDGTIVRES